MAGNYPSLNDSNFDLLKKITSNTAEIANEADIPSQPGNSGKLLTTNGTTTAWTTNGTLTSLTSPAATPLTLGLGTGGTALTLASSTLAATFAGVVTSTQFQSNVYRQQNGDRSLLSFDGTAETSLGSGTSGDTTKINANGVQALRIDASLLATFAGNLTVSGTGTQRIGGATRFGNNDAAVVEIEGAGTNRILFYNRTSSAHLDGNYDGLSHTFNVNSAPKFTLASTGNATFAGDVSAQRLEAVDAAANNRAAAFIRTQNNTTYSSSVLNIQGDRTTTNASYNLISAANAAGTGAFAVRDSGNAVNTNNSYGSISDRKLKENIVDATSKLEKLNQVRIVNFNRIGNEQKQLGVIAQELEQIFPSMIEEVIDRDAEGNDLGTTTKSVKYSVFVPMLIKAVQELTARLAAVEAK